VELLGRRTLELDLCSGIGNLDDALIEAEQLAADAYGADRSWFLVNGSTTGNQAMLAATCHPGDIVLISRNTHKSVISALVLSGARPRYLRPEFDVGSHIAHGVTPQAVRRGLEDLPDARAVLIVSPTYYGACSDIAGIAAVCHERGVPLFVDEAWGAHFPFHPELPTHALAQGADAAVTGVHKLLGALTQASMLHVKGSLVDPQRVDAVCKMLQSTSPSCLLYASLDAARMQMATDGQRLLAGAIELAAEARERLEAHPRLSCLDEGLVGSHGVAALDPTRLCVTVSATGLTGYAVERELSGSYDTVLEMADFANALANITIGHGREEVCRLTEGLLAIADSSPARRRLTPTGFFEHIMDGWPEQVMTPSEAFHSRQEKQPLTDPAGRISAEIIASYPPGIPAVVPGERLTEPLVEFLKAQVASGCRLVGPEHPQLYTIRLVTERARQATDGVGTTA